MGRQILSRKVDPNSIYSIADTYTQYDDKGRVSKIIPPDVPPSSSGLIFQYLYDGEDKIIYKKVPDATVATDILYNNQDLSALVRVPHVTNQWHGTKHDVYGRPKVTGLLNVASPVANTFAIAAADTLSVSRYDGSFFNSSTVNNAAIYRGKMSGNKVKILGIASIEVIRRF